MGYLVSMTTRRYKSSDSIERAMTFDFIQATIKAKRFLNGAEVVAI